MQVNETFVFSDAIEDEREVFEWHDAFVARQLFSRAEETSIRATIGVLNPDF